MNEGYSRAIKSIYEGRESNIIEAIGDIKGNEEGFVGIEDNESGSEDSASDSGEDEKYNKYKKKKKIMDKELAYSM